MLPIGALESGIVGAIWSKKQKSMKQEYTPPMDDIEMALLIKKW